MMVHVKVDCINILAQKRKTHAMCNSNPLFRVCHICHFDLHATVIHSHLYMGVCLGSEKLLTSKQEDQQED